MSDETKTFSVTGSAALIAAFVAGSVSSGVIVSEVLEVEKPPLKTELTDLDQSIAENALAEYWPDNAIKFNGCDEREINLEPASAPNHRKVAMVCSWVVDEKGVPVSKSTYFEKSQVEDIKTAIKDADKK